MQNNIEQTLETKTTSQLPIKKIHPLQIAKGSSFYCTISYSDSEIVIDKNGNITIPEEIKDKINADSQLAGNCYSWD
ncbi:MAG: hypothetical protein EOP33_01035 [Rickettsiaceae bacterium]|nr:MAG: hypothetical protein EOP33_01035 [Rickettsiaceae bacterium]